MAQANYDLERFVRAQEGIYDRALAELKGGAKRSHWMWFIFPQVKGLGMSEMSVRFAIDSLDEAKAYLAHDLLGPRLNACTQAVRASRCRRRTTDACWSASCTPRAAAISPRLPHC